MERVHSVLSPALAHNQDTWLALRVALQHPALATDPNIVCRIEQACRDWRAAVHLSDAGLLDIDLDWGSRRRADWTKFAALARWITECPGLIGSLCISGPLHSIDTARLAAEAALADSIALAAAAPSAAAANHTTAQLRLRRLASINLGSVRLLSALPAAYLTRLELHVPAPPEDAQEGDNVDGNCNTSWLAAVRNLSNLQHLQLSTASTMLPVGTLAALQTLQHLTYLKLKETNVADAAALQLLPVQLKQLSITLTAEGVPPTASLQLQHLTKLEQLKLGMADFDIAPGSQCPPHVTSLSLTCGFAHGGTGEVYPVLGHMNLTGLCNLQVLRLTTLDSAQPWTLAPLTTMTQLTKVSLSYKYLIGAAGAALAWASMPALQHLELSNGGGNELLDEQEYTVMMLGLQRATALTSLDLDFAHFDGLPERVTVGLPLCANLTSLSNLRSLQLGSKKSDRLESRDMLHLTALTGLTKLVINCASAPALDAMAAVAIACHVTRLVHLNLAGCDSECLAAIPAIALHQTRLRLLDLSGMEGLDDRSFLMLTTLCDLESFSPDCCEEHGPSREAWEAFWNVVQA